MDPDNWRNRGLKQAKGALNKNVMMKNPRREHKRFGTNKGKKSKGNLVIDEHIQEATPEHLRIEIDNIIAEFLADSEKTVYIFPSDLNNLQRKYIHCKAQRMNIISKSHGKEPNRQLHLKKKPREVSSQSFHIYPCEGIIKELEEFDKKYGEVQTKPPKFRAVNRFEKAYGRLQDGDPCVPKNSTVTAEMQSARRKLPIFEKRHLIMEAIAHNQIIIISSETGSGKTTQIPQYILEDACCNNIACKIVCTQPRRISTVAAAERVAYERGEAVGLTVGYHIRLESKGGYNTNLMYCTVGVFLRNLMCSNQCLNDITHVIVDEIHERDKLSDFMLICLKQNLSMFPHLRVILMSATVDTTKFQEYFQSSTVLSIPGRLFPIQSFFLEDVLSMTKFFTPQMRTAMSKLEHKKTTPVDCAAVGPLELSEQDQENLNLVLEAYMNFSEDYDYIVHYEEATADLLQLFISEEVPIDQQHSEKGWTALMIACHLGDIEFIGKLYTMGASLDVFDKFGKTAYDYARTTNKNNTLELLKYMQKEKLNEQPKNTNDVQFLRQLYDMTTPDDFIDYDLIVALIKYINDNSDTGSILIFLPGYDEIMQCNDHILGSDLDTASYRIFFLHSSMNMREQCGVFKPLKQRKIILSTNIAETSITVEDVVFVIDVGKAKEKVYDSYNKLSALQTQWISRACAKQREGRAGRVRTGFCFRLYSSQRFMHMPEERVPEILRVSLEELCLNAKIIAPRTMNIYNFLSLAPDPPTVNSVAVAIENLQSLGALDKEEDLTRLGEYLAQLTLEPRLGKMLIYGCIFKCLEPILTLCAAMAHKDPFQLPPQANLRTAAAAKRRELIENVSSDHVIYLKVFQRWQEESSRGKSKQFCRDYYVSESTMNSVLDTRRQLLGQLRAINFVRNAHDIDEYNVNCNSWGLVKAIMSAAFFPNIAYPVQNGVALTTRSEKRVSIHNTSVCSTKVFTHWCFFDEMVKNRISLMIRGVTLFTPLTVAIMCGIDTIYPFPHSVSIDDWLEFYFANPSVVKFRTVVQTLIEKCMLNPWHSFDPSNQIVPETLRRILDMEEKQEQLIQPDDVGVRPKFFYKIIHANSGSKSGSNGARNEPVRGRSATSSTGYSGTTNEWIEFHKKGRTPKRFQPPNSNQHSLPRNLNSAKALRFDNSEAITSTVSAASNVSRQFQAMNISSEASNPSPAAALLKGLGIATEGANGVVGYYNTHPNTYANYGNQPNGPTTYNDQSNGYTTYGNQLNGYNYGNRPNGFLDNEIWQNNSYYNHNQSYTFHNSNYGSMPGPSNNGKFRRKKQYRK